MKEHNLKSNPGSKHHEPDTTPNNLENLFPEEELKDPNRNTDEKIHPEDYLRTESDETLERDSTEEYLRTHQNELDGVYVKKEESEEDKPNPVFENAQDEVEREYSGTEETDKDVIEEGNFFEDETENEDRLEDLTEGDIPEYE